MKGAKPSPHAGKRFGSSQSAGTILFIEDDPEFLKLVCHQLKAAGYKVITATRAEEALERLDTQTPDLIILDISMPGMGGLGFLRRLNAISLTHPCPIIVLSGRNELEPFFNESVVSAFIPKTSMRDSLLQKVHELITQHHYIARAKDSDHTVPSQKLLLIEDDAAIRDHLTALFMRKGYEVCHAVDENTLLKVATVNNPSVVIIKYWLPSSNGPRLAEQMGSHSTTKHIPVLLYDETGLHSASEQFPNVRAFVPSAKGDMLLKAIEAIF